MNAKTVKTLKGGAKFPFHVTTLNHFRSDLQWTFEGLQCLKSTAGINIAGSIAPLGTELWPLRVTFNSKWQDPEWSFAKASDQKLDIVY